MHVHVVGPTKFFTRKNTFKLLQDIYNSRMRVPTKTDVYVFPSSVCRLYSVRVKANLY